MSPVAARADHARPVSAHAFRAFQATRPDGERWELIAGHPVMMAPPTLAHNRIAGNLERLLNDALARHDPGRLANQRPGIEIGQPDDLYWPEPDVAVIDADFAPGQRFVDRAYLLAEIVSASDRDVVPGGAEPWLTVKRRLYRAHPACTAILVIEQDRIAVEVESRTGAGWSASGLGASDRLVLPAFGLDCPVVGLYAGTPAARG